MFVCKLKVYKHTHQFYVTDAEDVSLDDDSQLGIGMLLTTDGVSPILAEMDDLNFILRNDCPISKAAIHVAHQSMGLICLVHKDERVIINGYARWLERVLVFSSVAGHDFHDLHYDETMQQTLCSCERISLRFLPINWKLSESHLKWLQKGHEERQLSMFSDSLSYQIRLRSDDLGTLQTLPGGLWTPF